MNTQRGRSVTVNPLSPVSDSGRRERTRSRPGTLRNGGSAVDGPPSSKPNPRRTIGGGRASPHPGPRPGAASVVVRWRGERGQRQPGVRRAKGATLHRTNFQAIWVQAITAAGLPDGFRLHDLTRSGAPGERVT